MRVGMHIYLETKWKIEDAVPFSDTNFMVFAWTPISGQQVMARDWPHRESKALYAMSLDQEVEE